MKTKKLLLTACLALAATGAMADDAATWTATTVDGVVTDEYFSMLNPTIGWRGGSYDAATKTFTFVATEESQTVYAGQDGWLFGSSVDVSKTYPYLNITFNPQANSQFNFMTYVQYTYTKSDNTTVTQTSTCNGVKDANGNIIQTASTTPYLTIDLANITYPLTTTEGGTSTYYSLDDTQFRGFMMWDAMDEGHTMSIANVFLTKEAQDWTNTNNVVSKTPSANYGTICLPYTATAVGAYIYQITGKNSDGNKIYITPYNGLLKAGVPYIYKATTAQTAVNFYEIKSSTEASTDAGTNTGLVGKYTGKISTGDYYVIKNDKLYKVDSDVTITNGAYIDMSGLSVTNSGAKTMSIDVPGTTGISSATTDETVIGDNTIYNISGMKVSNDSQRGIYIKNGKKYIK